MSNQQPKAQPDKGGRPRTDLGDLLVALGIASYFNKPSRKALVFKQAMLDGGYMKKGLSSATLRRFNDTEECSDMLRWALRSTALCAKEIERFYAVDSTHFKTPNSDLVVEFEAGKNEIQEKVRTAKMQIAFGVKTKMIFAMSVMDGTDSDQTALAPLLDQLNDGFLVDAILADSGYCSAENYDRVAAMGAKAYIDFRSTSRPGKSAHFNEQLELWKKGSPEWHSVYGLRALAETGNFILKETNRRRVRARHERSRQNELLAAAVVHNLARLLMVRQEFGIAIPFADQRAMEVIARADRIEQGIESGKVIPFRRKP
jgi:transposase